jgi:hypothetical protein
MRHVPLMHANRFAQSVFYIRAQNLRTDYSSELSLFELICNPLSECPMTVNRLPIHVQMA